MFLGILNTVLFNFSSNPFILELKIRSIQVVVITSFIVLSNVCIKRLDFTRVTTRMAVFLLVNALLH